MVARNVVVGMAKSLSSNETTALQPGITIKQQNNKDFSSKLSKVLGAVGIGSDLVLSSVGAGFTNGSIVYTNVPLIALKLVVVQVQRQVFMLMVVLQWQQRFLSVVLDMQRVMC